MKKAIGTVLSDVMKRNPADTLYCENRMSREAVHDDIVCAELLGSEPSVKSMINVSVLTQ